jgi:hypothetical protein
LITIKTKNMAEIKFGTRQVKNPTPASIERAVKIFNVAASLFIAWMPTNNIIGHNAQDIITPILGLLIGMINGVAPLFGIETGSRTVKMEDVTSMETPNKN